ncbi:MAG: hypothetical protein AAF191_19275, partial [Verrucomicrobiota bacterium]
MSEREVRDFDVSTIERHLKKEGLNFLRDQDDDYVVQFGSNDTIPFDSVVYLMRAGSNKDVYHISVKASKEVKQENFGKAMYLCNKWSCEKRWPKAA